MNWVMPLPKFVTLPVVVVGLALAVIAPVPRNGAAQEVVRSTFTTAPPTIDGDIGEDEWRPAGRVMLRSRDGASRCVFYFMNDTEHLYVAVSAIDDRTHTGVTAPGQFDNMAIWFRAEIGYWLYGNGRLRTDRIDWRAQRTARFLSDAKGAVSAPPATPNMMYELRIPVAEIGVQPGAAVSTGFHYWDNYDRGPSFWWPGNVGVFSPRSVRSAGDERGAVAHHRTSLTTVPHGAKGVSITMRRARLLGCAILVAGPVLALPVQAQPQVVEAWSGVPERVRALFGRNR